MKINPINQKQESFKALYKPKNHKFTEPQQRVIKDIEEKLGDRILEEDYSITPYGGYAVALRKVEGLSLNPYNNELMFEKNKVCAICDEDNLLDINKLDESEELIDTWQNRAVLSVARDLFFALAITGIMLTGVLFKHKQTSALKHQSEFVNKIDSLKNNAIKDSLNLSKML